MPDDSFKDSQLLKAFIRAGGSREAFLAHGALALNDTEEAQLRTAGVQLARSLKFLERSKALLGAATFSEITGEYRDRMLSQDNQGSDFPGKQIHNASGTIIRLILSRVAKLPPHRLFPSVVDRALRPVYPVDRSASVIPFNSMISSDSQTPAPMAKKPAITSIVSARREVRLSKRISLSDEIANKSPLERDSVAFTSANLVQANLPHQDPGEIDVWERRNGNFSFILTPGWADDRDAGTGARVRLGCPYGVMPRLTLIHIVSEVKRTGERRIKLADSFYDFLRTLGMSDSKQNYRSMKEQLTRLLNATVQFKWRGQAGGRNSSSTINAPIAKEFSLWWAPEGQPAGQRDLFESYILLDQDFYESIVGTSDRRGLAFPIDLGTVAAIKQSSLQLDMYGWMVHRIYRMHKDHEDSVLVSWKDLHQQFGSTFKHLRQFKAKAGGHVNNIAHFWRGGLKYEVTPEGLILKPSPLPVDVYNKKLTG